MIHSPQDRLPLLEGSSSRSESLVAGEHKQVAGIVYIFMDSDTAEERCRTLFRPDKVECQSHGYSAEHRPR